MNVGTEGNKADPLAGVWYSGVGSRLELHVHGARLTGFFASTEDEGERFPLHGSVDPDPHQSNRALSFSIAWITPDESDAFRSVTSYTGQYHRSADGEAIETIFLMADQTPPEKQYASVFVGYDNFHRESPSAEEVKRARHTIRPAHRR
jgi:hypothetical protein